MHLLARSVNPAFVVAVLSIFLPVLAGPAAAQPATGGEEAGFLGVSVQNLTPSLREALGLEDADGILVSQVVEKSPAEEAGIQRGDVLTRINNNALDAPLTLSRLVAAMRPGDRASVDLIRKGKKRSVDVTIGARPEEEKAATVQIGRAEEAYLGVQLHDPGADLASYFRVPKGGGVLVLSIDEGSPAEEAGIRGGDVILALAGEETATASALVRAVREHRAGEEVAVRLMRQGEEREIRVKLAEKPAPRWMDAPMRSIRQFRDGPMMRGFDEGIRKQMDRLEREMENLREEVEHLKEK